MSLYPNERNWSAMAARIERMRAEFMLQNLIGPIREIEDWPAQRVFDALRAAKEQLREKPEGI